MDFTDITNKPDLLLTAINVVLVSFNVVLVWFTLNESRKRREIRYIEKKLETFYLPLQSALKSVFQDEDNAGEGYIIEKAYALNKKLREVENYNYLASTELKKLIRSFPYLVYCFNNKSGFYNTGDVYYKMEDSLSKIETLVNEDINKYLIRKQKLTY